MDIFSNLAAGFATALSVHNLFYCFLGVFLGTLVGVIPGIGALSAIAMLLPFSFKLDPTSALILLAGIWYGSGYGGRTASILLNVPGTPSNAVTCLDGYPMTKQGRGGVALAMTTLASFFGGTVGVVLLMFMAPTIAQAALQIGDAEYCALMLLGLIAASTMSDDSLAKGLAMVAAGLALGSVGTDIYTGQFRFNFGTMELVDGISIVAIGMGMFGVAEIIVGARSAEERQLSLSPASLRAMKPTKDDVRRSWFPMFRGTATGCFFGTLPGTGATIAAFIAYAVERRFAKEPERFGKGAIEGVMAPESADNAAEMTAFIPTLALGVPGSATMALMLGALMINGIPPGPMLIQTQPNLFWGLVASFWIGNVMLVILNLPLIGMWVRVLQIPFHWLYPSILVFICVGAFSISNSAFDVWLIVVFGLIGYAARLLHLPVAPLILGFVLGPLIEEHFRRAMLISAGDLSVFFTRPISGTIMAICVLLLLFGLVKSARASRAKRLSARAG